MAALPPSVARSGASVIRASARQSGTVASCSHKAAQSSPVPAAPATQSQLRRSIATSSTAPTSPVVSARGRLTCRMVPLIRPSGLGRRQALWVETRLMQDGFRVKNPQLAVRLSTQAGTMRLAGPVRTSSNRPGAVGSRFSSTVAAPTMRATSTKPAAG